MAYADDMQFRLLGSLEVELDGQRVDLGGVRQERLLAVLLLANNSITPFSKIVDALWEQPPASARQQVHNAVFRLRRALMKTEAALNSGASGYRLAVPEERVDVFRFRSDLNRADEHEFAGRLDEAVACLQEALALWRGQSLEGLGFSGGGHVRGGGVRASRVPDLGVTR